MTGITYEEIGIRRNLRRERRASTQSAKKARQENVDQKRANECKQVSDSLASYSIRLVDGAVKSYKSDGGGMHKIELFGVEPATVLYNKLTRQLYTRILHKQIKERLTPGSRFELSLYRDGVDMDELGVSLKIRKLGRITN